YAAAILAGVQVFFSGLLAFYENPFQALNFTPADGQGMNPLLVHPAMAIHPPMLYLGYVGFVVPYAFAMAALISRQLDEDWIRTTQRWTIVPWFFLGTGQLLGAKWAYVVLGWGGYWGWDPVENAALLPWLTGTAYLHSVMIQEKKGMLKVWNLVLIMLTFTLCIYGTFLTRSGVVSSVHAFAQSPVGPIFFGFVLVIIAFSGYFLQSRLSLLKSRNAFESPVSRESGFLLNNLLFLTATFAVFWGTMFPVISEAVTGTKITVGPPFFESIMVPVGLLLLALTGAGPLLAWRRTSGSSLRKHFTSSGIFGLLCGSAAYALGARSPYALISFGLCGFVVGTIAVEFHRGALARRSSSGESYVKALWVLTFRNRRRYGGYIVHFGVVLLFLGFTGNAFNQEAKASLKRGDSMEVGTYRLVYEGYSETRNPLTVVLESQLGVYRDGTRLGTMWPEQRIYYKRQDQQRTTEVGIRSTPLEDLYVLYEGQNEEGVAFFRAYINPLVMWVWIGSIVVTLGTIVAMWPDRRERLRRSRIGSPYGERPKEASA
ncbi:MAG: cytochrome c-type biogenesis CcmF C-terminal domain-containing protein, partial [Candidatus Latescibacteria bacterium]|nr:cytochrome c-type biogenesis CcmF C-terminal domain-containing protein [Candidatus Latescibacterota bacterium]